MPDKSNTGQYLDHRANKFDTGDLPLRVFIVFGLKNQDLSNCHRSDDLCFGKTVWDDGFDLNSAEAQQGFLVSAYNDTARPVKIDTFSLKYKGQAIYVNKCKLIVKMS